MNAGMNPFNSDSVRYDEDGMPIPQPPFQPYNYPQTPPQPQMQYGMVPQMQTPPKSWIAAILLAFFLGTLGLHSFYMGYTTRGAIQLGLTVFGWLTSIILIGIIPLAIVGVWVFVDFIRIILRSGTMGVDSNGVPLN